MARITDYQTLKDAVIAVAEDDSAEFDTYFNVALDLAETRLAREVDALGMILTATVTAVSGNSSLTKPSGYKNGQDLWYTNASTGNKVVLKKRTYSYINDYWPVSASVGNPKYYADVDVSTFVVAPTANASIAMTLRYEGRPPVLTSANTTNYFTDQCVDALFFATLVEMYKFARNDTQMALYEQQYQVAKDSILREAERQRADNSGRPTNASLNTIKGTP